MTVARFEPYGSVYIVTYPFDAMVLALLKTVVPLHARTWRPNTRQWVIDAAWAPVLAATLLGHGCDVIGIDHPDTNGHADWARNMFDRLGPNRAPVAYRLLSKLCHPDTEFGDHQLQLELNLAFAELSTERTSA